LCVQVGKYILLCFV